MADDEAKIIQGMPALREFAACKKKKCSIRRGEYNLNATK
jgi:hypothetical protein